MWIKPKPESETENTSVQSNASKDIRRHPKPKFARSRVLFAMQRCPRHHTYPRMPQPHLRIEPRRGGIAEPTKRHLAIFVHYCSRSFYKRQQRRSVSYLPVRACCLIASIQLAADPRRRQPRTALRRPRKTPPQSPRIRRRLAHAMDLAPCFRILRMGNSTSTSYMEKSDINAMEVDSRWTADHMLQHQRDDVTFQHVFQRFETRPAHR